jgi:transposase
MLWRQKVELFDLIRRAFELEGKSVRAIAKQFSIHRRTVRQALQDAIPPERKRPRRPRPKLEPVRAFIDQLLEADRQAPRKQRHTAHRIYLRLQSERPTQALGESTVRQYVRERKLELGLLGREVCIPQSYQWGAEAQVDWYEAVVELDGEQSRLQFFALRSMASGAAFHRAYLRATQQAFLEAHQLAFHYFGGVFRRLRYDNLKSAVRKLLRGHRREETARFLLFRSHWQFEASFCNPGLGHEKGGVEGEVGYFRRNHLVPIPQVKTVEELNERLLAACRADLARRFGDRAQSVGEAFALEQAHLLPLQAEDFQVAEESFCRVDGKGCVQVRTNYYSTPLRPGTQARVRVLPLRVEVWDGAHLVACHRRCYQSRQQVLELEHYLDVLERKPGAFAGSRPLEQWRQAGRWTAAHDQFWGGLQRKYGAQAGTRLMIELLQLGRSAGYGPLQRAIEQALSLGATDAAAVRYLLQAPGLAPEIAPLLALEEVKRADYYSRPLPPLVAYDALLGSNEGEEVGR